METLVDRWLTLPELADALGLDVVKARQLIRDRKVLGLKRGDPPRLEVPAAFVHDGQVVKGLPGLITLLSDARYSDDEAIRWLFTPDDTLPGTPVRALAENRGTEAKRRAQALGF